jgi:NADH-quinone oxidoreductase subunit B
MSQTSNNIATSDEAVTANQHHDRYIFGTLDSFGKNREKLEEVNWGSNQPERSDDHRRSGFAKDGTGDSQAL